MGYTPTHVAQIRLWRDFDRRCLPADAGSRPAARSGGTITTIAGNGALGALGDNGPATSAQLGSVAAVATAEDGTLYVAQSMTPGRIRRIGIDGIITTVVGGGSCASIEGEPAQDICLQGTESVVIARDGTIYFSYRTASTFIDGIYRVGTDGIVHHVAGAAANTAPARAEGIDAREAWLDNVQGIAVSERRGGRARTPSSRGMSRPRSISTLSASSPAWRAITTRPRYSRSCMSAMRWVASSRSQRPWTP